MRASPEARKAFGERLRRLREDRRISGPALVEALAARGITKTQQSISGWEHGRSAPAMDVVHALEDILAAPGELVEALYPELTTRLDALEQRVERIEAALRLLVEQGEP